MTYVENLNKLKMFLLILIILTTINIVTILIIGYTNTIARNGYFSLNKYISTLGKDLVTYPLLFILTAIFGISAIILYSYIRIQVNSLKKLIIQYIKIIRSDSISLAYLAKKLSIKEDELERFIVSNLDELINKLKHNLEYDINTRTILKQPVVSHPITPIVNQIPGNYSAQQSMEQQNKQFAQLSQHTDEEPTELASHYSADKIDEEETAIAHPIQKDVHASPISEEDKYLMKLQEILGDKGKRQEEKHEEEEDETRVYV